MLERIYSKPQTAVSSNSLSGGINMKLSSVVQALGFLCLLLANGFPVPGEFPKIIGPDQVKIESHPGEQLVLHCDALSNCEDDITLIYWLVNGSFPEESDGRIVESNESTLEENTILHRSLLLKNVTSEDLRSTFTCVVTNAVGMAHKRITLATNTSGCSGA
ncbi:interleukin-18-binding protein-like isoform X2 [Mugil cephalus]|uniref:interleukin-18-binding protein-like isoform X2 n=1 Tax=Mugil cephalus TaxID=48193 RepID=UPI001FB798D8|nr:interleukin-18-binding protein-like isoform X2 [Mugil cephalus]